MEKDLFDWDGWDLIDMNHMQYYNVKLKVPIGLHPRGAKFDVATIDFNNGTLKFYIGDDAKVVGEFKLKLELAANVA